MKTVKFYTLGCKVNQYDTQSIRERFIQAGFQELEDGQPAEVYLINTCTVTHRADSDSFGLIRKAKRENPQAKIIVTGCLAEKDSAMLSKAEGIDFIVSKSFFPEGITNFSGHTRAFLKIQDGCNNYCSYCKVPLVRGRSRSRPLDTIIQEVEELVKNGYQEIVLSGICLGTYDNLINLIESLEKIVGLLRIRLSSIDAPDVTDELIDRMANSKKLCPHLHIPLQSGDDEILKKMNRNYSSSDYRNLIKKIKRRIPEIAITTDVLIGFPIETENNFQNTVNLIKETLPLKVHIFPYSKREGTSAAKNFKYGLSPVLIKERMAQLKNTADACALTYKKQFLNTDMAVLIENRSQKNLWQGYTDNYIRVQVRSAQNLKSQLLPLRLKKMSGDFILADFC